MARARPAAQARELGFLAEDLSRLDPAQAGRAHQARRGQRRGAIEPVLDSVALLDRLHGPVLVAGGEGQQDGVAGGDAGNLRKEEPHDSRRDGEHRQRPHAVEEHRARLQLRQARRGPGRAEQPRDAVADPGAAPEDHADHERHHPPARGEEPEHEVVVLFGAHDRQRSERGRRPAAEQHRHAQELTEAHQAASSASSTATNPGTPSTTRLARSVIAAGPSSDLTPTQTAASSRPSSFIASRASKASRSVTSSPA